MQTFRKEERLSSKKTIDRLFSKGESFTIYPFKVVWIENSHDLCFPVQILISVSKKKFKRAVDRNLIKRRIREAYRKNKAGFYESLIGKNKKCVFALLYISDEIGLYKDIEQKIILILQRLQSGYEQDYR